MPRVDNCHLCLYTTVGFKIHHSTSLRCRDAPIPRRLVDSTRIQDHWYPGQGQPSAGVCGAGTTSHCRKSSFLLSHDMTSLDMQFQPIRFVATDSDMCRKSPQDHRGVFFPPTIHQILSGVFFWATFMPLHQGSEVEALWSLLVLKFIRLH